MTRNYVLPLNEASLKDTPLLGGKGANLGELMSANFNVPPGFGVISTAYDSLLSANDLNATINELAASIDYENPDHIDEVTAEIRSLIAAADVPDDMVKEIEAAYAALGEDAAVAVRSSSAVPDLGVSYFPGEMDTIYDVIGIEGLLYKLTKNWYGEGEIVGSLLCGLPDNRTVQANESAWLLSRNIVESPYLSGSGLFRENCPPQITAQLELTEEGRSFLQQCATFSREYAFRAAEDREISCPRWGDDLDLLIGIIKTFVQAGESAGPEASEAKAVKRREEATAKVLEKLSQANWGRLKRRLFNFLLKHAQN